MKNKTPRNAAKPPGGKRVTKAEELRRLDAVEALLMRRVPRHRIVAQGEAMGLSARTVDSYIARARERWAAESLARRGTERERSIARLAGLSVSLEVKERWSALIAVEKLLLDVEGIGTHQDTNASARRLVPGADGAEDITDLVVHFEPALRAIARGIRTGMLKPTDGLRASIEAVAEALDATEHPKADERQGDAL